MSSEVIIFPGIKKGEIYGEMIHPDGRVEKFYEHLDEESLNGFVKNLVVDQASILMAQLAKGDATGGIKYIAVGTGVGTGDTQNPEAPNANMYKLRNEIARKPATISYYTGAEAIACKRGTGRTNMLDITVEFGADEAVGALTEMAVFGGDATATKDSGDMLNCKTFPVWNKPQGAILKWTWRFTF